MPLFKTSNPALGSNTFRGMSSSYNSGIAHYGGAISASSSMTLSGTVHKTGVLLVLAVASAFFTWTQFAATHDPASVSLEMMVGVFGGLIFALVTSFKREWSPITAPIYALLEGLFLGAFSAMLDLRYPGIAIQAVGLTFATLFVLLFAYSTGIIKVTQKLRLGIVAPPEESVSSTSPR
jgi:uncharacterized YccA/Bax inhibitor family protein